MSKKSKLTFDPDMIALLVNAGRNPNDRTAMLVAADRAQELNLTNLEELLRWLGTYQPAKFLLFHSILFTGSRRYGTPKSDSDVDWVIVCNSLTRKQLTNRADEVEDKYEQKMKAVDYEVDTRRLDCAIRFNCLNLICIHTQLQWDTWSQGTLELMLAKPVTRDFACDTFQKTYDTLHAKQTAPIRNRERKYLVTWSV